jgi:aryl-alcohol dehydrogenase-like predicted oxidoreductase
VILATKIAGNGDYTAHIRTTGFSPTALNEAVDNSLKRLKTDYIDLYQLHWPERQTNTFGIRDYKHNSDDKWEDNFNEILLTLDKIIKSGKIRHIGISNEKAWGTMRYLEESKTNQLPRMITIQNAYSLLNRVFEGDMAEIALREDIGLLAYSPMAFGVLSGKYIKGTAAENARLKLFPRFSRYSSQESANAVREYLKIAQEYNLTLAQMSLAFVTQQPFITSNIIGATNLKQLEENIDSINIDLNVEILDRINLVHKSIPNPAP